MNDLSMWQDATRKDELHILMVDPHDFDTVRGELQSVYLDKTSVTLGYYSDTRSSATIGFLADGGYIEDSWVRIVHECPDYGYRNELGTWCVKPGSRSTSWSSGAQVVSMDLMSVLWALSVRVYAQHYTIGKGAKALDAFDRIVALDGKQVVHQPGVRNYRYTDAKVFDLANPLLSDLFTIADIASDRLDCDGHGRVTIAPYIEPSSVEPSWYLDKDDPRTVVLSSEISKTPTTDSYGESVVTYTSGKVEISASAQAPSTSSSSYARRGFMMSNVHSVSELSGESQQAAQALADGYLKTDSYAADEWSLTTKYFPVHPGETLVWAHDGEEVKCLVKTCDPINLADMTIGLTIKEVA